MITLEQVDKLREYANISRSEAKEVLERAGGDLLEAVLLLEQEGKMEAPKGGGLYASSASSESQGSKEQGQQEQTKTDGESAFRKNAAGLGRWLRDVLHKGNTNALVVTRKEEEILRLPITLLVLLFVIAFWVMLPLMVVGLFFSFRYSFQGPDIKSAKVNHAMDTAADAAEEIKSDMKR